MRPLLRTCFWIWGTVLIAGVSISQEADAPPVFDQFFQDRALRLEMMLTGDSRDVTVTLNRIVEEPCWPGSPQSLLTPFPYGRYRVRVEEAATNRTIYSYGLDSLYGEYATTTPAREGVRRSFEMTVRIPMPLQPVKLNLERRNSDNTYSSVFQSLLAPDDLAIRHEAPLVPTKILEPHITGPARERVDILFLSEGYAAGEVDKFEKDVKRLTDHLLSVEPYQSSKERINVRGVFQPSQESGTDDPRKGVFRNTVLQSSFNTLDIDRYLLLEDNHRMHQMAACVPYDTIVVLVNSATYGGGSICMDYCVCSSDSGQSEMVFIHELGHGLAYLADEYVGNVTYNDMYPEGIEPVEPNITRNADRETIKWRAFLTPEVPLPTPNRLGRGQADKTIGAFEGGGYLAKGMYRSEYRCWMGSAGKDIGFCRVCIDGIQKVIDYYSPVSK